MSWLLRAPERSLRCLLVTAAAALGFLPLLLLAPRHSWWQEPEVGLWLLGLAGLGCLRGELDPALADGWAAERAQRYAPAAAGLLFALAFAYPTLGTWPLLWLLLAVQVALLPFAYVSRVRAVSLCVSSVAVMGLTVLDARAALSLAPVGLAWALLPGLDRLARVRLQLSERPGRTSPTPFLLAGGGAFLAGVLLYAALSYLLPPSSRDFEVLDLLAPVPGGRSAPARAVTPPPVLELLALLALVVAVMLLLGREGSGARGKRAPAPEAEGGGGGVDRLGDEPAAPAFGWPSGPRRRLVDAYAAHLRRLQALGHRRRRGSTPAGFAVDLGRGLSREGQAASARLAERFGRARWSRAQVDPVEAEVAEAEARLVEEALRSRSGGAE